MLELLIFCIATLVVMTTVDIIVGRDNIRWPNRMILAIIIGLVLGLLAAYHYNRGYEDGVEGRVELNIDYLSPLPAPQNASHPIPKTRLDPELQAMLKDVTGQPETPEPVRDIQPAQSAPVSNAQVWDAIAACESNNNWHIATGNGYRGGLQWNQNTWEAVKPDSAPNDPAAASREQEIAAANNLMAEPWGGYQHWPVCSKEVGLR